MTYQSVNWNEVTDRMDKITYDKLNEQIWFSARMVVSKDKADWRNMTPEKKEVIQKVFATLNALDSFQSNDGISTLHKWAHTPHEKAVLNNIQFMESEHANAYSSIFSTLNTPREIKDIFKWAEENEYVQHKLRLIDEAYSSDHPYKSRVASVLLESFAFYSGFYAPLRCLGEGQMIATAEVIKLIVRDESVHGSYIGYKARKELSSSNYSDEEKEELKSWVYDTLFKLYQNETKYISDVYNSIGWAEDVDKFTQFNANRALSNLGLDPLFAVSETDINPLVLNGLSTTTSNHDFFSTVGNGYLLSPTQELETEHIQFIDVPPING